MQLENPEETGHPHPQPKDEFNRPQLSDRKKREARIDDYLLPAVEREFATPIPLPPDRGHPDDLLKLVAPHLPLYMLRDKRDPEKGLDFECELVLVAPSLEEQNPQLAVQRTTRTAISRELVDPSRNDQLLREVQEKFPEYYQILTSHMQPASPDIPVYSGGWGVWNRIRDMGCRNRAFAVLNHMISQAPSRRVRFEQHKYVTSRLVSDEEENTTFVKPIEQSVLIHSQLSCEPVEHNGTRAVKVDAHLPCDWQSQHDVVGEMFDTTFYVLEDGILVPDEEMNAILTRLHGEGRKANRVFGWPQNDEAEAVRLRIKIFWEDIAGVITRRQNWEWSFAGARYLSPYSTNAFGQELKVDTEGRPYSSESLRVFDAEEEGSEIRSQDEVDARIFMTVDEAEEYERWEEDTINKLTNEIIPSTRDLTSEQALIYAAEIVTRSVEPLRLLEAKFSSGTRLAIIGMVQHPPQDRLPLEVIEQSRRLGIGFVAIHVRNPDDPIRVYKEDREGLVAIEVSGLGTVEMPHEEAQRKYPEQYKALFKENREWDGVIAAARKWELDILYVEGGDSWSESNQEAVNRIGAYLEQYPEANGIYFSPLLSSLYWPGDKNQEERQHIGARPFVDVYSLAYAHLSDTSIQMAAYGLRERFPGKVYSMPQFIMPRGFGKEWGHFRQVVDATGIPERFALDNISETPFAIQRYLFNTLQEFKLGNMSDEELAEFLVLVGGGFWGGYVGIVEINWGKLIDGVIVYPSDAPLPKTPTPEELMDAAADYIANTIKDNLGK